MGPGPFHTLPRDSHGHAAADRRPKHVLLPSLLALLLSSAPLGAAEFDCPECRFRFPGSWQARAEGETLRLEVEGTAVHVAVEAGQGLDPLSEAHVTAEERRFQETLASRGLGDLRPRGRLLRGESGEALILLDAERTASDGRTTHEYRLVKRCNTRVSTDLNADSESFSLLSLVSAQVQYTHEKCIQFNVDALPFYEFDEEPATTEAVDIARAEAPAPNAAPVASPAPEASEDDAHTGCLGPAALLLALLGVGALFLMRPKDSGASIPASLSTRDTPTVQKREGPAREAPERWGEPSMPLPRAASSSQPTTPPTAQADGLSYGFRGSGEVPYELLEDSLAVLARDLGLEYASPGIRRSLGIPAPLSRFLEEQNGGRVGRGWLTLLGVDRKAFDLRTVNASPDVKALYGAGWVFGFTAFAAALVLDEEEKVELRFPDGRGIALGRHLPGAIHAIAMKKHRDRICSYEEAEACRKRLGELAPGEVFLSFEEEPTWDAPSLQRMDFVEAAKLWLDLHGSPVRGQIEPLEPPIARAAPPQPLAPEAPAQPPAAPIPAGSSRLDDALLVQADSLPDLPDLPPLPVLPAETAGLREPRPEPASPPKASPPPPPLATPPTLMHEEDIEQFFAADPEPEPETDPVASSEAPAPEIEAAANPEAVATTEANPKKPRKRSTSGRAAPRRK
jgi:hypothetical protein